MSGSSVYVVVIEAPEGRSVYRVCEIEADANRLAASFGRNGVKAWYEPHQVQQPLPS